MKLLLSQKNQVFDLIGNHGFSQGQFKLAEHPKVNGKAVITLLTLNDSEYYFRFDESQGKHYAVFSPGVETITEQQFPRSWSGQLSYLSRWLNSLKRELEQRDKWGELFNNVKSIGISLNQEESNSQFTYDEVSNIYASIEKAKKEAEVLHLTAEQTQLLNSKLDYIADKAKSFGRIDWKNIFIGTMMSLMLEIALPDEAKKQLWRIIKGAFETLLKIYLN